MNKNILLKELESKKISKDLYDLNGGLPNEAYCLSKSNGIWEVYYSERGVKSGLKTFGSESEACEYLLNVVTNNI